MLKSLRKSYRNQHSQMGEVTTVVGQTKDGQELTVTSKQRVFTGPGFRAWVREHMQQTRSTNVPTASKLQRILQTR